MIFWIWVTDIHISYFLAFLEYMLKLWICSSRDIIIYYDCMIGFRGLIPKTAISYDSYESITKKADEVRKNCQLVVDFFGEVSRFNEIKAQTNLKTLAENGAHEYVNPYNKFIFCTLQKIIENQRDFAGSSKLSASESITQLSDAYGPISLELILLDQSIKWYQESEQKTYEESRRYYKAHKNLLSAVELYKTSFSDVNLIYNMEEKNRRYQDCQNQFVATEKMYQNVNGMCGELSQRKQNVLDAYQKTIINLERCVRDVGRYSIDKTKEFVEQMSSSIQQTVEFLRKFEESNITQGHSIFRDTPDLSQLSHFNNHLEINSNCTLPFAIEYPHLLRQESFSLFDIEITSYLKMIEQRLKARKSENKKVYEFIKLYFGNINKIQDAVVKEVLVGFEKNRKKISEVFGNRFVTFLKVITSLFEISVGINEKMMLSSAQLRQSIQACLSEGSKLVKCFSEQTRSSLQKFVKKKQSKKQDQDQSSSSIDLNLQRKEICQKSDFIKHLISGFEQKIENNYGKFKGYCNELVSATRASMKELYQFSQEYVEVYFGNEKYEKNMAKFKDDFEAMRKKYQEAYMELQMHALVKEETQITFEGEFSKISMVKKLKKPAKISSLEQVTEIWDETEKRETVETKNLERARSDRNPGNLTDTESQKKHADFLNSKVTFKQQQLLIKTFSCSLSQNIRLQGKLFLTTQRICFHSNFNSKNLFFGHTFIQFPKSDIKKIQKRKTTLLFDNSISFTTVNGEILFTSFSSRDQAYDSICRTFNFCLDNQVYQYEEKEGDSGLPEFLIQLEEPDDIKIVQLEERKSLIQKEMQNFQFADGASVEFSEEGLNALKIFKIFYHNFEIIIGGRRYDNYLAYYKQTINHSQVTVDQWTPSLSQTLNQCKNKKNSANIKQSSPLITKRRINSTVPVSASGVPFMPKTAQTIQNQCVYFFSKHKFVLQSTVQTFGVPYCDTFKVELRTTVESNDDGKCKVSVQYFVNFVKSTMMKGVIEGKTKDQTLATAKIWITGMKKYFQALNDKSKKKGKSTPEDQLRLTLNEANSRVEDLEEQNKDLREKVQKLEKSKQILQLAVFGLFVLFFVLLLLK